MKTSKTSYSQLNDIEKEKILQDLYVKQNKSFADIALEYDTYPNRVRRDAKKYKISIRTKSEAQKNALSTGKHKHPTKGKIRDQQTKEKIGMSVLKAWESLSDQEIKARQEKSRIAWESMDQDVRDDILRKANIAVRDASKTGSKLEKFLFKALLSDGYKVDFHKEQVLVNTKLQVDIFLPTMNTAIEVDGPSHFEPVWGNESLSRNKKYDNKKTGLVLGKGWVLIRIKQAKDFSESRAKLIYQDLQIVLNQINDKFPDINHRIFELGDQNG
jgi:very-short-patch-repair endonuclease